jgi:hypothetical protein
MRGRSLSPKRIQQTRMRRECYLELMDLMLSSVWLGVLAVYASVHPRSLRCSLTRGLATNMRTGRYSDFDTSSNQPHMMWID